MSAIHILFRIGLSAAMLVLLAACDDGTETVSVDIMELDITQAETQSIVRLSTESIFSAPSAVPTVREILPDFRAQILAKRQENRDVVGWLSVPGTAISSPVLQNPTGDSNPFPVKNDYYLNTDFYGAPDKNGTFCADHRASFGKGGIEGLSRITAIYGHSWSDDPDGTLFSQLKRYRDTGFAETHPYIYFSTDSEEMVWEVCAVFDTTVYLPYVRPNLPDEKLTQTLDMIHALTYYNYDVAVSEQDKLLVLSTCTYSVDGHASLPANNDYRFVVMAKYVAPDTPRKSRAVFSVNRSRVLPDETMALWAL